MWEFPKIGDPNSTLNSRILRIRTPKRGTYPCFRKLPCEKLENHPDTRKTPSPTLIYYRSLNNYQSKRVHIHYHYGIIGPKNHNGDGLLVPNSIVVVYMDPLGILLWGFLIITRQYNIPPKPYSSYKGPHI